MERKHLLFLFFLTAVPFFVYIFGKFAFIGMDTYYFLDFICYNGVLGNESLLFQHILSFLPCNFAVLKGILFLLAFLTVVGVAKTGELFYKNGWLAGLFVFFAPVFFFEFAKFENDQFAFPILVWATYFFLKGTIEKKVKYNFLGIALVVFAGLFWQGAIFYLPAFGLISLIGLPYAVAAIACFGNKMFNEITPTYQVTESLPFVGLIYLGVFLSLFVGIFLQPVLILPSIYFLIIATANSKFVFHSVLFLSVAALSIYNNPKLNRLEVWGLIKTILVFTAVVMALVSGLVVITKPPTLQDIDLVEAFVAEGGGKNDWSYGHWVNFYGGNASASHGGNPIQDYNSGKILTAVDLNCLLLSKSGNIKFYDCG